MAIEWVIVLTNNQNLGHISDTQEEDEALIEFFAPVEHYCPKPTGFIMLRNGEVYHFVDMNHVMAVIRRPHIAPVERTVENVPTVPPT
jgi:hypothetical protein